MDRERIPLEVFPGAENYLGPMTAEEFAEKAVPLGPGRRYVLFDFAMDELVSHVAAAVEALARRDRTALIAHPERNRVLQADPRPLADWVAAGARIQVNAGSVLGRLGEGAHRSSRELLEAGAVHALASDAHGVGKRRPFCLDRGRDAAAEIVGAEEADRLTRDNPWRIARGEPVDAPAVTFEAPRGGRFWKRLLGGQ
jgi:protein-tyrosine phosphatase